MTKYNYENLITKIKALDLTKRWRVNISEEKVVRSLEQNERLWSLYGSIANYIGEDPSTVHELLGYKFLPLPRHSRSSPCPLSSSSPCPLTMPPPVNMSPIALPSEPNGEFFMALPNLANNWIRSPILSIKKVTVLTMPLKAAPNTSTNIGATVDLHEDGNFTVNQFQIADGVVI